MGDTDEPLTYATYLRIPELLDLQQPVSEGPEHDEMLFIVIHQVYELWFKQIIHELDRLGSHLDADESVRGIHQLKRIRTILKVLVHQLDVLETMTPLEFLSFRDFLGSASGFQSAQFRELEFVLGAKEVGHLDRFRGMAVHAVLQRRYDEPSVWARFVRFLSRRGYRITGAVLDRPSTEPTQPSTDVQDALVAVYRTDPELSGFCELLTDVDEGFQEWRYRHVMMVQRTIGTKQGTGGSPGADYLRSTLFQPFFPDLWEIRSSL